MSAILARSDSTTTTSSNSSLKIVGIVLAIVSGFLIGSSFVFKKKGLLRSQAGGPAGEGVAYLKSVRRLDNDLNPPLIHSICACLVQVLWWSGMISSCSSASLPKPFSCHSDRETVMILGELCNFAGPFNLPRSLWPVFPAYRYHTTAYAFVEAIVVVSAISPLSQAR